MTFLIIFVSMSIGLLIGFFTRIMFTVVTVMREMVMEDRKVQEFEIYGNKFRVERIWPV